MNRPYSPDGFDERANAVPYEFYFASGQYDRRYPRPNPSVLRLIRQELPPVAHVVDFGCGSGRYLLALRGRVAVAAGYDICAAALARFRERASRLDRGDRLHVLGPQAGDLDRHMARHGPADVVLCLFGVLSHIEGAEARGAALRRMAGLLRPGTGRLILSVPNRRRRFLVEQRAQAHAREIRYVRRLRGMVLEMSYKLFDIDSLRAELAAAGLSVERLAAESLMPEALVARSPILRGLDRLATPWLPAALGYGIVAVARPTGRGGA